MAALLEPRVAGLGLGLGGGSIPGSPSSWERSVHSRHPSFVLEGLGVN